MVLGLQFGSKRSSLLSSQAISSFSDPVRTLLSSETTLPLMLPGRVRRQVTGESCPSSVWSLFPVWEKREKQITTIFLINMLSAQQLKITCNHTNKKSIGHGLRRGNVIAYCVRVSPQQFKSSSIGHKIKICAKNHLRIPNNHLAVIWGRHDSTERTEKEGEWRSNAKLFDTHHSQSLGKVRCNK